MLFVGVYCLVVMDVELGNKFGDSYDGGKDLNGMKLKIFVVERIGILLLKEKEVMGVVDDIVFENDDKR